MGDDDALESNGMQAIEQRFICRNLNTRSLQTTTYD
jgi:hypothetical protein